MNLGGTKNRIPKKESPQADVENMLGGGSDEDKVQQDSARNALRKLGCHVRLNIKVKSALYHL